MQALKEEIYLWHYHDSNDVTIARVKIYFSAEKKCVRYYCVPNLRPIKPDEPTAFVKNRKTCPLSCATDVCFELQRLFSFEVVVVVASLKPKLQSSPMLAHIGANATELHRLTSF